MPPARQPEKCAPAPRTLSPKAKAVPRLLRHLVPTASPRPVARTPTAPRRRFRLVLKTSTRLWHEK